MTWALLTIFGNLAGRVQLGNVVLEQIMRSGEKGALVTLQETHFKAGSAAWAAAPDNVEVPDVHVRLVLIGEDLAPVLDN